MLIKGNQSYHHVSMKHLSKKLRHVEGGRDYEMDNSDDDDEDDDSGDDNKDDGSDSEEEMKVKKEK